jgi:hypothetical protein
MAGRTCPWQMFDLFEVAKASLIFTILQTLDLSEVTCDFDAFALGLKPAYTGGFLLKYNMIF